MKTTNPIELYLAKLEQTTNEMLFGTITINVVLKNSIPLMETMNLVKSKRRKYKYTPEEK
jgi:hypothetical protein